MALAKWGDWRVWGKEFD